ncbi:hypothetical protein [Glycomyces albidus]|uniref:Uncharacterized protein n=1 Tax=Glycomyces albidus TaxID=2656774 RepID=A0A6L5G463_9ACTN|nr:hypothetical protein [Glycomyces albidus]MQM24443.1 hypothetical protein [Glycomyces albidus]
MSRNPRESTGKPAGLRRFATAAAVVGAAAVLSVAMASPAQAEEAGGGSVTCGPGQSVAVYSTGTVGDWSHLVARGYDTVRRSGATTSPTTVYTRTTFNSISRWSVVADAFDRAGARCL